MMWVRLDDCFDDDPRVTTAGAAAAGLLTMLLAYSNRNLSDGFVSASTVRQKAAGVRDADALIARMVKVGLMRAEELDGIAGFRIDKSFVDLQPTREQVEAERQAAKTRKERWRERQRNADGTEPERRSEREENGSGSIPPDPDPDPDPRSGDSATSARRVKGKGTGKGNTHRESRRGAKSQCGPWCFGPCGVICYPLVLAKEHAKALNLGDEPERIAFAMEIIASFRDDLLAKLPLGPPAEKDPYKFWRQAFNSARWDPAAAAAAWAERTGRAGHG